MWKGEAFEVGALVNDLMLRKKAENVNSVECKWCMVHLQRPALPKSLLQKAETFIRYFRNVSTSSSITRKTCFLFLDNWQLSDPGRNTRQDACLGKLGLCGKKKELKMQGGCS